MSSTPLAGGICRLNREICLHSQTNSRRRSHYQSQCGGATAFHSFQCEGRQFQDARSVRKHLRITPILTHCLAAILILNIISRRKEMELLGVSDTAEAVTFGPMESKGNLVFKFVVSGANIPILMQNLEDPVPKVLMMMHWRCNKLQSIW